MMNYREGRFFLKGRVIAVVIVRHIIEIRPHVRMLV